MTLDNPSLVAIIGLIATIVGFVYTWFNDARHRKWQREDAERNNNHLQKQDNAIAEGTVNAKEAYSEANRVNMKIADLQEELKRLVESQTKTK